MSDTDSTTEAEWLNLLLFSVKGICFGVDLEQIESMTGHDGEVAADLHWLHELPGFDGLAGTYQLPIVLSIKTGNHQPYRVIIDSLEEIAEFQWSAISPLPGLLEVRLVKQGIWGVLQLENRMVVLVDFQRIARNR